MWDIDQIWESKWDVEGYFNLAHEVQMNSPKLGPVWSWGAISLIFLLSCRVHDEFVKKFSGNICFSRVDFGCLNCLGRWWLDLFTLIESHFSKLLINCRFITHMSPSSFWDDYFIMYLHVYWFITEVI